MSRSDKSVAQTQGVGQKGTRRCKQKDKKLIMTIAVVMVLGVSVKLRV
jgi:ribosomal protein L4